MGRGDGVLPSRGSVLALLPIRSSQRHCPSVEAYSRWAGQRVLHHVQLTERDAGRRPSPRARARTDAASSSIQRVGDQPDDH